eukprot:Skav222885  [mRNA]  locus=scaffold1102:164450:164749:- [translate_table: standard]
MSMVAKPRCKWSWSLLWFRGTAVWSEKRLARDVLGETPSISVVKSEGWVVPRIQALKAKVEPWRWARGGHLQLVNKIQTGNHRRSMSFRVYNFLRFIRA